MMRKSWGIFKNVWVRKGKEVFTIEVLNGYRAPDDKVRKGAEKLVPPLGVENLYIAPIQDGGLEMAG